MYKFGEYVVAYDVVKADALKARWSKLDEKQFADLMYCSSKFGPLISLHDEEKEWATCSFPRGYYLVRSEVDASVESGKNYILEPVYKGMPIPNGLYHRGHAYNFDNLYFLKQSIVVWEKNKTFLTMGTNGSPQTFDQPVDPRRHNTYLKIIAAALCQKGDVSPLDDHKLAGQLVRRIGELGLEISPQTVKDVLKQTIKFIVKNSNKSL